MLFDDLNAAERSVLGKGYFKELVKLHPQVTDNLAQNVELRDYQAEALGRYFFYMDDFKSKKLPVHLLFNMATGSGKTVLMACMIVDLYARGYRNFIFFTRLGNIVEKTRLNFLNSDSIKYLFSESITINGEKIAVKAVSNFDGVSNSDINILFTTTADLHYKLSNPTENSITFQELEGKKIALIADEAHNLTADTRSKLSADELLNISSWESTVSKLLESDAKENVLLEFTATARLDSDFPEVLSKYQEKAIFKYDLKQYRLDGYSKDVNTFEIDAPVMERVLVAILLSQYRLKVAEKNKLQIKPVVMFKSNLVTPPQKSENLEFDEDETRIVSSRFKSAFHEFISGLQPKELTRVSEIKNPLLEKAFEFFKNQSLSFESLVLEIQRDFAIENCLTVDENKDLENKQVLLNTLEDPRNLIRAVFATQKLNEGWDVLNLFDIVRLYNSRDAAKNKAGKTTVEEAQLIGRGARYNPFKWSAETSETKRKFDDDIDHEMRVLEELHYHSKTNPRYIQELRSVLTDTGILPEKTVNRTVFVKPSVKNSKFWQEALLYTNSLEEDILKSSISNEDQVLVFNADLTENQYQLLTRQAKESNVFSQEGQSPVQVSKVSKRIKLADLGPNVLRTALWRNPRGSFDNLSRIFPNLVSSEEFIVGEKFLGSLHVSVSGLEFQFESLLQEEKLGIASFVVNKLLGSANTIDRQFYGSRTFKPVRVSEIFEREKLLKLDANSERARAMDTLDLAEEPWFAQNEIWGTSEEKELMQFLKEAELALRARYEEFYVFRNEMHFKMHSFRDGSVFYPDFVLFAKTVADGHLQTLQVLIEPKGDQFLDSSGTFAASKEGWKQEFLEELEERSETVYLGSKYKLIGLPFFNSGKTEPDLKAKFADEFRVGLGI